MVEPNDRLSLQEFWDAAYQSKDIRWLADYQGPEIWKRLDVAEQIKPGAVVLNIGVGTGACTRALAERGCIVHALDLSPAALEGVRDVARTWTPASLARLPQKGFDLALSHLVAQSMLDEALADQIKGVLRGLARHGIFAMQFAKPVGAQASLKPTKLSAMGGSVWRTPDQLAILVRNAGGTVLHTAPKEFSEKDSWAWHVFHIVRKDFKPKKT